MIQSEVMFLKLSKIFTGALYISEKGASSPGHITSGDLVKVMFTAKIAGFSNHAVVALGDLFCKFHGHFTGNHCAFNSCRPIAARPHCVLQ